MIDIHTHILPVIDDGSDSIDTSIEMIKHEIDVGVDSIVLTPHYILNRYNNTKDKIIEQYKLLKAKVEELGLKVNLLLGEEICYTSRTNIIEMLDKKELLTLNNTNYVLLEFDFNHEPDDIYEIIYNFKVHHYKVILAHVERYSWMNLEKLKRLINEGIIVQVNSNAIIGKSSLKENMFVKKLVKLNLIDIVASDTHSFRISTIGLAYKKLNNPKLFNFNLEDNKL